MTTITAISSSLLAKILRVTGNDTEIRMKGVLDVLTTEHMETLKRSGVIERDLQAALQESGLFTKAEDGSYSFYPQDLQRQLMRIVIEEKTQGLGRQS